MALLNNLINIATIIIGFGVLIFIHELGHFLAAKWAGIRAEAFAVGMGPVAVAWRRGIGLRFGSTAAEYEKRVNAFLATDGAHASVPDKQSKAAGELPAAQMYRVGDKLGLGETEYSLRWFPVGGFVKMLGQEDANPNAVSDDPRSYNMCLVPKRMVVVSAGVIMNIILAVALFIIAFMVGVKFEAPVIGGVEPNMPAANVRAGNADALKLAASGLQPGDEVISIDGEPARTFADLSIASAMSRPDVPIKLVVRRSGVAEPLEFTIQPEKDPRSGLLGIGIDPGRSTTLMAKDQDNAITEQLEKTGLAAAGVRLGMRLTHANGQEVRTFEQLQQQVRQSEGKPIGTQWIMPQKGQAAASGSVQASLNVEPVFERMGYVQPMPETVANYETGLFGLSPLPKIEQVMPGSKNVGILKAGDVVLRVGSIEGPRTADLQIEVSKHPGESLAMTVLRDGKEVPVVAQVDRKGKLNIGLSGAWDVPQIAQPMTEVKIHSVPNSPELQVQATPVANMKLFPLTRIDAVGDVAVSDWNDLRRELRRQTDAANAARTGATVSLAMTLPMPDHPRETQELHLDAEQVARLHALSWQTRLPGEIFDPIMTTLTAGGNPLKALSMGFAETRKAIVVTYLTIDRLFRGSVGVEQLRGPVGIIHLGSKVADRGLMYMVFFLGMISVNLAVINFLPLPIVDGGLFLFLIYEKFKGRPPSLAFQNAATIAGLFLIGTVFLVTFYNDVLRLLG